MVGDGNTGDPDGRAGLGAGERSGAGRQGHRRPEEHPGRAGSERGGACVTARGLVRRLQMGTGPARGRGGLHARVLRSVRGGPVPGNDVRAGRREGPAARSDVMRRWLWCAVLAVSMVARAQEGHASPPHAAPAHGVTVEHEGHEKVDTSTYILEHVADSPEVEFQVPLSDKEFILHFPVWRIPLREGACPANTEEPAKLSEGCLDISLTKHTFWMLVGSVFVVLLFTFGANRNPKQPVPHGPRQNILEMLVIFVRNEIAIPNIGKEEGPRYVPYLLSVFFFILTLNLLGLVPWASTATGNLAVTCALALCTFVLTQVASIRAAGIGGYLKHLTGGSPVLMWVIMIPVE